MTTSENSSGIQLSKLLLRKSYLYYFQANELALHFLGHSPLLHPFAHDKIQEI